MQPSLAPASHRASFGRVPRSTRTPLCGRSRPPKGGLPLIPPTLRLPLRCVSSVGVGDERTSARNLGCVSDRARFERVDGAIGRLGPVSTRRAGHQTSRHARGRGRNRRARGGAEERAAIRLLPCVSPDSRARRRCRKRVAPHRASLWLSIRVRTSPAPLPGAEHHQTLLLQSRAGRVAARDRPDGPIPQKQLGTFPRSGSRLHDRQGDGHQQRAGSRYVPRRLLLLTVRKLWRDENEAHGASPMVAAIPAGRRRKPGRQDRDPWRHDGLTGCPHPCQLRSVAMANISSNLARKRAVTCSGSGTRPASVITPTLTLPS